MMPCRCRNCGTTLTETFADLGMSPLSNAFIPPERARNMEPFYPLHARVCSVCRLVQLEEFESPEHIFNNYIYFSSFSDSWLQHAAHYAKAMLHRFDLGRQSVVVEVASNDGYLLQFFQHHGCRVLGVEPAANVAEVAIGKGIPSDVAFFGKETATRLLADGFAADLMIANNVLAHVPDLHDFVDGLRILLKSQGVLTVEVPHLLRLMQQAQFDTIYHEHFSYFSLNVVHRIFLQHGLRIFDVEELPTHGGSLRVFACLEPAPYRETATVSTVLHCEKKYGLESAAAYEAFSNEIVRVKIDLLNFLIEVKKSGKSVVGYGAPAKGNTLLNYCGVGPELLPFTVDRNPYKQGALLPGTRIPVRPTGAISEHKPDYVLILPWNLRSEIMQQMSMIREWGGRFLVPIPRLTIY